MAIMRFDPSASVDELHAALHRDGALIIENLASVDQMDAIRAEMQPFMDATPKGDDDFAGRNTRRSGALIARSPSSHELVQHPQVLGVAEKLLDRAKTFQLHLTQTIAVGPGSPAQAMHRDEWAFDFFEFPSDYHVQCNTIWALTDFSEHNGATRVIPGSQADPPAFDRGIDADGNVEWVSAEMTKGSCLMYTGKVFHGAGANESDDTRIALNLTYNVGWLRQEENQYLSMPAEAARDLPDDLLRLMGYQIGAYALGYVDDIRDPLEVLRGTPLEAAGQSFIA